MSTPSLLCSPPGGLQQPTARVMMVTHPGAGGGGGWGRAAGGRDSVSPEPGKQKGKAPSEQGALGVPKGSADTFNATPQTSQTDFH